MCMFCELPIALSIIASAVPFLKPHLQVWYFNRLRKRGTI